MTSHDLIVIGGGPAGYVASIRAAQLGLNVACVEKEPELGGTCLRIGCIPSKALLESSHRYAEAAGLAEHGVRAGDLSFDLDAMMKRKDKVVKGLTGGVAFLFKKNKITRYAGHARLAGAGKVLVDDGRKQTELGAMHVLIATGSRPTVLPGLKPDYNLIGTSTEALAYSEVPETLVVVGAGYIGLELGSVWRRLGSRVIVVEYLDRILPGMDSQMAAEALKMFSKQGLEFRLSSKITKIKSSAKKCTISIEGAQDIVCDRVLLSVGRTPNTSDLGLETVGIEPDERGRIGVDEDYRTSAESVYAVGDVIGGAMLAHMASEEGIACVDKIVTGYGHVDYGAIPAVVYTSPEIASVGASEDELRERGVVYKKGEFPFSAIGRAKCIGDTTGFVKVLADAATDRVLGVHIIGSRAGDLIAEAATAIAFSASSEDIGTACHAHPTLAEALKEAALAVTGSAIHI